MNNVPPLVHPCTDKMDLERFSRDLPKYKPWLTNQSWGAWEDFITSSHQLSALDKDVYWMLPDLQAAGTAVRTSNNDLPPSLSEEAQSLLEKETSIPKKVRFSCHSYMS